MRVALRSLAKSPGFVIPMVITLAIGIGANSAIFTIIDQVLFRPTPWVQKPRELAVVCRAHAEESCDRWAWTDIAKIRETAIAFSSTAAYRYADVGVKTARFQTSVHVMLVSPEYFRVLGVPLVEGRDFTAEESNPTGGRAVAVVGPKFCREMMGGCGGALGSSISLNGTPFDIVRVTAEGFHGTELGESVDLWIPLAMERVARPMFGSMDGDRFRSITLIGRLTAGATPETATAQLAALGRQLSDASVDPPKPFRIVVNRGIRFSAADEKELVLYFGLIFAVSLAVLLVACANAANMVLTRAWAREREVATRMALGAGLADLARLFGSESLIIGLLSGAAGLVLSHWAVRSIRVLEDLHFAGPDWRVFVFVAAISGVVAAVFGIAPVLSLSEGNVSTQMKEAGSGRGRMAWLREILVAGQIALSLSLALGAVLAVQSVNRIRRIHPGFDASNLIEVHLNLRILGLDQGRGQSLYGEVLRAMEGTPGFDKPALARTLPVGFTWSQNLIIPGHEKSASEPYTEVAANTVSPRYFSTLGVPMLAGRMFDSSDTAQSPKVIVVSQAYARKYCGGRNCVGQQVQFYNTWDRKPGERATIVGVAADTSGGDLDQAAGPMFYRPLAQHYEDEMVLVIRTAAGLKAALPIIASRLAQIESRLAVFRVDTVAQRIASSTSERDAEAAVLAVFGGLAVLLAGVGLYSSISYAAVQRRREFGIRMALGAGAANIRWLVARSGLRAAGSGLAAGGLVSVAGLRVARALLLTVKSASPEGALAAVAILCGVVLLALAIPAERAIRVDPMTVLRDE